LSDVFSSDHHRPSAVLKQSNILTDVQIRSYNVRRSLTHFHFSNFQNLLDASIDLRRVQAPDVCLRLERLGSRPVKNPSE